MKVAQLSFEELRQLLETLDEETSYNSSNKAKVLTPDDSIKCYQCGRSDIPRTTARKRDRSSWGKDNFVMITKPQAHYSWLRSDCIGKILIGGGISHICPTIHLTIGDKPYIAILNTQPSDADNLDLRANDIKKAKKSIGLQNIERKI